MMTEWILLKYVLKMGSGSCLVVDFGIIGVVEPLGSVARDLADTLLVSTFVC
jgi:hypothetical protein